MASEIVLLFGDGVELVASGVGGLAVRADQREVAMPDLSPGVAAAMRRLAGAGGGEDELARLVVATDGPAGLPVFFYLLEACNRQCLIAYRAVGERGPLATAVPMSAFVGFRARQADARRSYVLSRFSYLRREGGGMVVESPLSAVKLAIHDARLGALCVELAAARRLEEPATGAAADGTAATWTPGEATARGGLSQAEWRAACSLLLGCRMLVEAPADAAETAGSDEDGMLPYWELGDLLFHARSRLGRHDQGAGRGFGGTYHFAGRREPEPATKPPMSEEAVDLHRPDLEHLRQEDMPLTAALEARRSRRSFGASPVTLRQLGELLYRTARQRDVFAGEHGEELSSRPYPGGGAIYELEIYVAAGACADLAPGLYHYCPRQHRLYRLASPREAVAALLQDAAASAGITGTPQVLLTIAARFPRVFWKYEGMGYAVILKDAGVLIQTMYLVAEAMGLAACALGAGNADLFAMAAGVDYYAESSVGEVMLGSRS